MVQITATDARAAAGLILRRMPREHAAIVHSMGPQPELQFKYLKVLQSNQSMACKIMYQIPQLLVWLPCGMMLHRRRPTCMKCNYQPTDRNHCCRVRWRWHRTATLMGTPQLLRRLQHWTAATVPPAAAG